MIKNRDVTGPCKCRACGHLKMRKRAELVSGQYVYRDLTGLAWSRRTCPSCNKERAKGYSKTRRSLAKEGTGGGVTRSPNTYSTFVAEGTKLRACRDCGRMSPNYYLCGACTNEKALHRKTALSEFDFLEIHGAAI